MPSFGCQKKALKSAASQNWVYISFMLWYGLGDSHWEWSLGMRLFKRYNCRNVTSSTYRLSQVLQVYACSGPGKDSKSLHPSDASLL